MSSSSTGKLQLTRPLVFFDLETTGVNVATDRIVEISLLKLNPDGTRNLKTWRTNPGIPIPAGAAKIHGITDDDVKDKPKFKEIARELRTFLEHCDLAGYNVIKFDLPLLAEEFARSGFDFSVEDRAIVDVQNIFHKMEQRTLSAAYKFYCDKDLTKAHTAEGDTEATFEVLIAQLERYEKLPNDVPALHKFSSSQRNVDLAGRIIFNENGVEVFNFGKHKGKPVSEIFVKETSYYDWMMNGDFAANTKSVITRLRLKDFNKK
ncbi:MAG: 3'-5' exonuclease [Bacteroidia bacterium]|nr:3'-5' exonuclease [Bacteroidia bacterium]